MADAGFNRIALACASMGFFAASALALAAADWPPPIGFLWLETVLAILAVIVYVRVRSRLAARSQGRRVMPAALEGVIASLAGGFGLLAVNLGDPDITMNPRDHLVWILMVGLTGAAVAQVLWGVAVLMDRLATSPSPDD